jgi:hypothetical protein
MLKARLSEVKVLPSPGSALVTRMTLFRAGVAPSLPLTAFNSGHLIRRISSSVWRAWSAGGNRPDSCNRAGSNWMRGFRSREVSDVSS